MPRRHWADTITTPVSAVQAVWAGGVEVAVENVLVITPVKMH